MLIMDHLGVINVSKPLCKESKGTTTRGSGGPETPNFWTDFERMAKKFGLALFTMGENGKSLVDLSHCATVYNENLFKGIGCSLVNDVGITLSLFPNIKLTI